MVKTRKRPVKELGMPLGVFSTLADQGESDSSQLKVTSPKKGKFQFSPRSLFTSKIGHSDTSVIVDSRPSSREPIVSTKGTNPETNSPIPVLNEVLEDTMATSRAAPGTVLVPTLVSGPAPVPVAGLSVPIAVQMGVVGDRTTSVAPLSTFTGWPGVDPYQHFSQFLTACIANNGNNEDVWLRWLPTTLKDTAFEWYDRQLARSFPNWNALREAFLLHFRPIGFED